MVGKQTKQKNTVWVSGSKNLLSGSHCSTVAFVLQTQLGSVPRCLRRLEGRSQSPPKNGFHSREELDKDAQSVQASRRASLLAFDSYHSM